MLVNKEQRYPQETITGGNEACPLEYVNRGFKEIARTEVDVPVITQVPITTYVEEEVCQTVTIPTYMMEFNQFRVAPVKIRTEGGSATGANYHQSGGQYGTQTSTTTTNQFNAYDPESGGYYYNRKLFLNNHLCIAYQSGYTTDNYEPYLDKDGSTPTTSTSYYAEGYRRR